uniref:RNA-directed DNA polymerase n=1 Tax=Globodera rostochiensis TaxID=31243 RepID=A0A914H5Z1_GLORO
MDATIQQLTHMLRDQQALVQQLMTAQQANADCSAPNLQDGLKVKLVLAKLSEAAFNAYAKSCLPKEVTEFNFAKTVEQLQAPGIFQCIMDSMLADCPFAIAYLDDVIVVSRFPEEHRKHLEEVFERMEKFGFRIKPEICTFFQNQIKYLGFIIDKNGRRPDSSKIQAISAMPVPNNVPELRSFLGMINHYQQFVKNMRFIRQPLDDLLKQDTAWDWSEKCQGAFEEVIKIRRDFCGEEIPQIPFRETLHATDGSQAAVGHFRQQKGIKAYTAHRLQRWALILLAYDFDIEYQNTAHGVLYQSWQKKNLQ